MATVKWIIQCISDHTLYWNCSEGWMTTSIKNPDELRQYADIYTNKEKQMYNLPIDGKWKKYE